MTRIKSCTIDLDCTTKEAHLVVRMADGTKVEHRLADAALIDEFVAALLAAIELAQTTGEEPQPELTTH